MSEVGYRAFSALALTAPLDECKIPARIHCALLSPQWSQTVSSESSCTQTSCLRRGSSLSILCCLLLCSGILLSVLFTCPFACLFCLGVFWDCLYSLRFHFLFCLSCLSILQEFTSCFCLIFWILLSIFYILFKQLLGISFQVFMSSL